ncbi:hypothetical protein BJ878DRAFT_580359 [Calycina marina]|uniref:Amino acid transporter transmembrane domain-containing protein n=1 Tax=Calycina marina TaxID=1763456 RepID=A0A9P8CIK0_9HELO|nr:hypothetical protein BJ878DRAFT_580359 [Calycina marina]
MRPAPLRFPLTSHEPPLLGHDLEAHKVFKKDVNGMKFRSVGWLRACDISESHLRTGVFSIPTAICHSIADMAEVIGDVFFKKLVRFLFLIAYVCADSSILSVSIGLNVLSTHAVCTVWWWFIAATVIALMASVRKFDNIGWVTWSGCISIFAAVFIVVIAVTTSDHPTAALQTGPFDLGYYTASATILVFTAGTSVFLPVISEMRQPKDFRNTLYTRIVIVNVAYLSFQLVVYKRCLGSAGPTIKKVVYGVGLIGLIVSACPNPVPARISFLVFNHLIVLTGSVCFAPLAFVLAGMFWLKDFSHYRGDSIVKRGRWRAHCFIFLLVTFLCVVCTYGVICGWHDY